MEANAVLSKVRALLAKAEATTFDAEAEAFTAKAQELIARHRIDRALLDAEPGSTQAAIDRRIDIATPYVSAKALLLSRVANANECRVVFLRHLGSAQVFGCGDDVDAVEELYTSLLVQVTTALHRAGPKHDPFGRSRTRSFRHAFLVAFAVRVGERLRATVDATVDAVPEATRTALVPMITARGHAAEAAARAEFPFMRSFTARVSDPEGMHAGSLFADHVELSMHRKLASR
jgi:hypothetical protein